MTNSRTSFPRKREPILSLPLADHKQDVACAGFGPGTSYATADDQARFVAAPAALSVVANDTNMQVVVIKGHRLTAAEKAALD